MKKANRFNNRFSSLFHFLFLFLFCALSATAQVTVEGLSIENRVDPVGIDVKIPRFSWKLRSDARNCMQTAYEVKVWQGKRIVWQSGKIQGDQSLYVPYQGEALSSGKKYEWQVRVWDQQGKASPWSSAAYFYTGLFSPSEWKAKWIESAGQREDPQRPAVYFRKSFKASGAIRSAMAFFSAHGMYEAHINGKRVGDACLAPGWTSYKTRHPYQAYDVTTLLKSGDNALGVVVGNGWYRGYLAWGDNKDIYGKKLGALAQLEITYADGRKEWIITDDSWKSSTGPIRFAEIYHGETIDARQSLGDWTLANYADKEWLPVQTGEYTMENLIATANEPIRKKETFSPVKIFRTPQGEQVIDFGQNLVGWVVVKARGNAGDSIVISHAEVLDKQGNFYTENMRSARTTATYVLSGKGEEVFEPHFTFFGFRYIRVKGYNGDLQPENFKAVAMYSDMPLTGSFSCSHPLLNQLQHNIQWGQRGNFLDVPTDCPQRDERLGWTGDAQAFSRTAAFNFGVSAFFAKWLKDLAADQLPNGSVPFVIPNVLGAGASGSTGWADAATIIPWNMYLSYGDTRILEEQYPSMKAWVGYMEKQSKDDLWNTGFHFGDWLFYRPFDDNDGRSAVTDKYLIAQCFYAHSTQLMIQAARVLGKKEDQSYYENLLARIRSAFLKEYLTPNGRLVSGTQTAYVLALQFDMLPESLRMQAADRLEENIKSYGNHLSTGFLGTPYLCHVLSRFGKTSMAYTLLLQESYPSWLYPVKMGATTIWERWNGIRTDSTFEPASMNSFNHYAYGAIGDWMYRVVAGLDTDEKAPGYKHLLIRPTPGEGIDNAAASLETPYGKAASSWRKNPDGSWNFEVTVPANTRATIWLPIISGAYIEESGRALSDAREVQVIGAGDGEQQVRVGSGTYRFTVAKK